MLFGLLSLLMGHWIVFVAKICVKTSSLSRRLYPCAVEEQLGAVEHFLVSTLHYENSSTVRQQVNNRQQDYCPEGEESFASHESLEQLHRLMFVLAITHVCYSFTAIALAMIKIYSWRTWENQAKTMAIQSTKGTGDRRMTRLSTFIFHRTAHPWSQHKILVWLLCFSRQFWSSINQVDYMALRFGFITRHQLPLTYDFHIYMLRSMEEEFRDIVGISVPLWVYSICCIVLDFHGTNLYFWLSFLPAIVILLIGTKLHRVVVKLATEIQDSSPELGNHQLNLRDELFWFRKPRLLLRVMQFISFQNAFEMATFIWSLWEIRDSSCFMENRTYTGVRLTFGVVTQFWFSSITFPLYVIVTQMGGRFKKAIVSETVRRSLHGWQRRVRTKRSTPNTASPLLSTVTVTKSLHLTVDSRNVIDDSAAAGPSELGGASRRLVEDMYKRLQEESCGSAVHSGELSVRSTDEMLVQVPLGDVDSNDAHRRYNGGDEDNLNDI
ncbi:hypothetical protein K2173_006269 [Erythroxylum novogranatense]|uniref:MLO-like protein n=1 Tax=Erythroxylum novogranatense TaxID=1862640 RepID=A0AAV8TE05_9ROSI|nr:hypothetical protein K2173_006269 [Erythroxylum novogranatense]